MLTRHRRSLSLVQRGILAVGCGITAVRDPYRYDCVAYATEATTLPSQLEQVKKRILSTDEGRRLLDAKPIINTNTVDFEHLKSLAPSTLGHEYQSMLERQNISPDTRVPVKCVEDEEAAYVMLRYRQIHDFLHLLLDAPTNFEGESAVKAFEFSETGFAVPFLGATAAPFYRLNSAKWKRHQKRLATLMKDNTNLHYLSVFYEERWDQDIDQLRKEIGIPQIFQ